MKIDPVFGEDGFNSKFLWTCSVKKLILDLETDSLSPLFTCTWESFLSKESFEALSISAFLLTDPDSFMIPNIFKVEILLCIPILVDELLDTSFWRFLVEDLSLLSGLFSALSRSGSLREIGDTY